MCGPEVWIIYDKDDYTSWEEAIIEKKHIYISVNKFWVLINNVWMQPVEVNLVGCLLKN